MGENMDGELSSTLEDYLEAIFRIEKEKRAARVRDISSRLGVAKSTVNAALKSLAAKELINYSPYELIVLTEEGREKASDIVVFHRILYRFLKDVLALGEERAEKIACEMEHAVDREAIERFCCFLAYVHTEVGGTPSKGKAAKGGKSWIEGFRTFMGKGSRGKSCKECIREHVDQLPWLDDEQDEA